jgi:hypothetical protein
VGGRNPPAGEGATTAFYHGIPGKVFLGGAAICTPYRSDQEHTKAMARRFACGLPAPAVAWGEYLHRTGFRPLSYVKKVGQDY